MKNIKVLLSNLMYCIKRVSKLDKWFIPLNVINSIVVAISNFVYPFILMVTIKGIEEGLELHVIIVQAFILIIIYFLIILFTRFLSRDMMLYRRNRLSILILKEFYFNSLLFDYELFEDSSTQDAFEKASRATSHYNGMVDMVVKFGDFLTSIITILAAASIILFINPIIVVVISLLSVAKYFLMSYNTKKRKSDFRDKIPNYTRKYNYVSNISRNLALSKDLKVYSLNIILEKEHIENSNKYLELFKKDRNRNAFINSIIEVFRFLDEICLYSVLCFEVLNNRLDIATFTFMVSNVRTLIANISRLITDYTTLFDISYKITDYREFFKIDLYESSRTVYITEEDVNNNGINVTFDHVYYSYLHQDGYTLKDLTFTINKGERVALVGLNGAGKTTLVKLLVGFYHPTKGNILINGININNIARDCLVKLFAPVFQNVELYGFSIYENVSMKPLSKSNVDEIEEAIKLSGSYKKVDSLELKGNTILSRDFDEKGVLLSGGEAQKLSLARTIYKKAPFVILDEPTSALDALAEANLYNTLNDVIGSSSAIFISHRLSSTKFCDSIIVLDKGEIIEKGTHDYLMSINSTYKEYFDTQSLYYKSDSIDEAI